MNTPSRVTSASTGPAAPTSMLPSTTGVVTGQRNHGVIGAFADRDTVGLHLVLSGRPDGFRMPVPFVRSVMSHRTGIALNPAPEHGDLFRCRFPLPKSAVPVGRAFVVNEGIAVPGQIARPPVVDRTGESTGRGLKPEGATP